MNFRVDQINRRAIAPTPPAAPSTNDNQQRPSNPLGINISGVISALPEARNDVYIRNMDFSDTSTYSSNGYIFNSNGTSSSIDNQVLTVNSNGDVTWVNNDNHSTLSTTGFVYNSPIPDTTIQINEGNNISFGFSNGSRIQIDMDGEFELRDVTNGTTQTFNIFELSERIERLEALVKTLTHHIPRKFSSRVMKNRKEM